MSLPMTEQIKAQFGTEQIAQLAGEFRELEASIRKAVSALVPTVMMYISALKTHPSFIQTLENSDREFFLKNGQISPNKKQEVDYWVGVVFNSHVHDITTAVATYSGVNNSSANALLKIITSVTIALLSEQVQMGQMNLNQIEEHIGTLEPMGRLSLPEDLVITKSAPLNASGAEAPSLSDIETITNNGGSSWVNAIKWLVPTLLFVSAGILSFIHIKEAKQREDKIHAADTISLKRDHSWKEIPMKDTLIRGKSEGFEEMVISFLMKKDTIDSGKAKVFIMERVQFESMSEQLRTASSWAQIKNLAMILRHHPEIRIEILVYNNDIDHPERNRELSQKRAEHIYHELMNLNVGNQVIRIQGKGTKPDAVKKGATPEERNRDRKIEITIIKP